MATYSNLIPLTPGLDATGSIQSGINVVVGQMQEAGETPDWTTLAIYVKDLPTGWQAPGAETVTVYGILMESNE